MQEPNLPVEPAENDFDSYLSLLREMQNSLGDDAPEEPAASLTSENFADEFEMPTAFNFAVAEPSPVADISASEIAPVAESNGYHADEVAVTETETSFDDFDFAAPEPMFLTQTDAAPNAPEPNFDADFAWLEQIAADADAETALQSDADAKTALQSDTADEFEMPEINFPVSFVPEPETPSAYFATDFSKSAEVAAEPFVAPEVSPNHSETAADEQPQFEAAGEETASEETFNFREFDDFADESPMTASFLMPSETMEDFAPVESEFSTNAAADNLSEPDAPTVETALDNDILSAETVTDEPAFAAENFAAVEFTDAPPIAVAESFDFAAPAPPDAEAHNLPADLPSRDYSETLAAASESRAESSAPDERFIVFKLDEAMYAIPAANVVEIGEPLAVTPLPFLPSWFSGIGNLRGDILAIISLREFWGKREDSAARTKMIVMRSNKRDLKIAVLVDAVREIRRIPVDELSRIAARREPHLPAYQLGSTDFNGQTLHLLDAEEFLSAPKFNDFK